MIISKYTFFINIENKYYLYNSLSNALIEIDKTSYLLLEGYQNKRQDIDLSSIDEDIIKTLVDKRFICNTIQDELLYYKSLIQPIREQKHFMHLTIAPTMDCCFNCFYCFENHKSKTYMTGDVMSSIVQYVRNQKELKNLVLTWFGGEPLMAQAQMKEMYNKLQKDVSIPIKSTIITTGYHVSPKTISLFKEMKISSIQITLDGNKDTHNKIKFTEECNDVYSKVINNVEMLSNSLPETEIVLRINLTKENAEEFPDIYHNLRNRFSVGNVNIVPAMVKDKSLAKSLDNKKDLYFTNSEFSQYILRLYNEYGIHTPFIRYPGNQLCECAIRDKMAISIDPSGNVYKCWEKIGDEKYSIGRLTSDGKIEISNKTEINRELYGADPFCSPSCINCKYLPICNGGCPIDRIQNEFEGSHNDTCSLYKGKINEFIQAHLKMKSQGIINR